MTDTTDTTPDQPTDPDAQAEASADNVDLETDADANGATKGYLGQDAADIVQAVREEDDPDSTAVRGAVLGNTASAATFRDPVPPGGHPADPTSLRSVGAAADSDDALAKAEATRL